MSELSTAKCYLNDGDVWWRMEADQKKTSSNLRCFYESKVQTVTNEETITEDERDIWVGLENQWVFLLFLKIGVCFQKLEFVFENRNLLSKRRRFVLQNHSLKIGVLLKLRPRLCAFFSHVGSTLRRGIWKIHVEVSSCQESNRSTASDYSSSPFSHTCPYLVAHENSYQEE